MFAEHLQFVWIAIGVAGLAIAAAIAWFDPAAQKINSRVAELEERVNPQARRKSRRRQLQSAMPSLLAQIATIIPSTQNSSETLQARLSKAGIYGPSAPSTFVGVQTMLIAFPLAAGLCGVVGFHWPLGYTAAFTIGAAATGWLAPRLWLDSAVKHRHLVLRRSLPDFLDLMIVCLQGGLSVQETIRRVSDEFRLAHPELAGELLIVQRDIELGATVEQALRRFAIRSDYDGVRTLSSFVRESQKFGTQLTEALRLHAEMLRLQREEAAEERAQKAAVMILLPTLLLIFPAVFVVLVGPALIQIQEAFAAK